MSNVIKIIKENELSIPIGTILHYTSFFDKPKTNVENTWDSVGVYIWQDSVGKLHIIDQNKIWPALDGYYINVVMLSWMREFLYEGDEYWKVFTDEREASYHKLEFRDGKHHPALLLKPYKDIVYSNTNFMPHNHQRFKTLEAAYTYCFKVKNGINVHY